MLTCTGVHVYRSGKVTGEGVCYLLGRTKVKGVHQGACVARLLLQEHIKFVVHLSAVSSEVTHTVGLA